MDPNCLVFMDMKLAQSNVFFSVFSLSHVIAIHTESVLGLSILFHWSIVCPDTTSSSDGFPSWYLAEYILPPSSFSVWRTWIYLEVCSSVQNFKSACQGPYKTLEIFNEMSTNGKVICGSQIPVWCWVFYPLNSFIFPFICVLFRLFK